MNDGDLKLKLLAGRPIQVENCIPLRIPKSQIAIDMGESVYNQMLSNLLFDKKNIESVAGLEELDNFEVLYVYCYHNDSFRDSIMDSIKLFFKEEAQIGISDSDMFFYFGEVEENLRIDKNNFAFIQKILREAHYIADKKAEEEFKPANSKAQEMIDMILKGRRDKPKPKETVNLHSIISGLAWRPNDINLANIFDLTIYQIYTGYFTTANIDNYNFTLTGIYTGNVDAKNINMSEINWAKILEKQ